MNKLVLGVVSELPRSWRFVDANYLFPNPADPFMVEIPESIKLNLIEDRTQIDFIGIKTGDPTSNADPHRLDQTSQLSSALYMNVEINQLNNGSLTELIITPISSKTIDGFQFSISYDTNEIAIEEISNVFNSNPNLVLNLSKATIGQIGITYVNYSMEEDNGELRILFNSRGNVGFGKTLNITDSVYFKEGYINGVPIPLKFIQIDTEEAEIQAYPNPFNSEITVNINSDYKSVSQIIISDLSGRLILSKEIVLDPGMNTEILNRQDFENAGIYILQLRGQAMSDPIKVVLVD